MSTFTTSRCIPSRITNVWLLRRMSFHRQSVITVKQSVCPCIKHWRMNNKTLLCLRSKSRSLYEDRSGYSSILKRLDQPPDLLAIYIFVLDRPDIYVHAGNWRNGFGDGIFLSVYFTQRKKWFVGRVILLSGFLIAFGFLFVSSATFFKYEKDGVSVPLLHGQITSSHRAVAWKTAFQTFAQNPILGKGIGEPVAESRFTDPSGRQQLLTDAHNTFLSVLAETGLLGFFAIAAVIGFILSNLIKSHSFDQNSNLLRVCLLIILIDAFLFQGLTGSYEDSRHLWVLFGIAAAAGIIGREEP